MTIIYVAICFLMLYSTVLSYLLFNKIDKIQTEFYNYLSNSILKKDTLKCDTLKCQKIIVENDSFKGDKWIVPSITIEAWDRTCSINMNSRNDKSKLKINCDCDYPSISIEEQNSKLKLFKKEGDE